MKRILTVLVFWLFTYPIGMAIWIAFEVLSRWGFLEVRGIRNFPKQKGSVLLVSNHCSLVEPILLIGPFGPKYALHPWKYGPWNLADNQNYFSFQKWGWAYWPMWPRLIRVDRSGRKGGDPRSLITARNILRSGGNIILFPEGGRTLSVKTGHLKSHRGKLLRPLKSSTFLMAKVPAVLTVPVWFEFHGLTDMRLSVGKPRDFSRNTVEEIAGEVEKSLLELADTV